MREFVYVFMCYIISHTNNLMNIDFFWFRLDNYIMGSNVYDMSTLNLGFVALITTVDPFDILYKNVLDMEQILTKLRFKVVTYSSVRDIQPIVNEWGERDHSQQSGFMCVIISHHSSNIPSLEELTSPFVSNISLQDKPKIFFIWTDSQIGNYITGSDNYVQLGSGPFFIPIVISTLEKYGESASLNQMSLKIHRDLALDGHVGRVVSSCGKEIYFHH